MIQPENTTYDISKTKTKVSFFVIITVARSHSVRPPLPPSDSQSPPSLRLPPPFIACP